MKVSGMLGTHMTNIHMLVAVVLSTAALLLCGLGLVLLSRAISTGVA